MIRVELRIGMKPSEIDVSDPGLTTGNLDVPTEGKAKKPRAAPIASNKALDIFWDKRIRDAGKMARPSPLYPKGGRRRVRHSLTGCRQRSDVALAGCVFYVGGVGCGIDLGRSAYWYTSAFSPAPISKAHAATQFNISPAIATTPNAGSCTNCHSLTGNMEQRCAACHRTDAFVATVIKPHEAAGDRLCRLSCRASGR